jgi:hypothetical protein
MVFIYGELLFYILPRFNVLIEIFTSDELMIGDCILFDLVVNEAYYRVSVQSVASLGMQWKMFSKVVTVSLVFFFAWVGQSPLMFKNVKVPWLKNM